MKRTRSHSGKSREKPTAAPPITTPPISEPAKGKQYWLLKTEPDELGWSHLEAAKDHRGRYDGVRGPGPRNSMKTMQAGDLAFFYHSGVSAPHIAGVVKITEKAFADPTQFDPKSKYFDAAATKEEPKWYAINVEKVAQFPEILRLPTLREHSGEGKPLAELKMLKQGRLSVSIVTKSEWDFILGLAKVNLDE